MPDQTVERAEALTALRAALHAERDKNNGRLLDVADAMAVFERHLDRHPSAASESSPLRPAVLWFAREMEEALRRNDHKGTWIDCDTDYLWSRLKEEIRELKKALDSDAKTSHVTREAADVANFAMMLADTSSSEVHDDAWYLPIEKEPADPVKRESPCRRCALEREEAIRERDRLRGELTETKAKLEREEREHGHTIDQRERYHDAADRLAYAIADEEVIGEHSSSNDPWEEALEALEAERRKHGDDLAKAQAKADEQGRVAIEMFDALKAEQVAHAKTRREPQDERQRGARAMFRFMRSSFRPGVARATDKAVIDYIDSTIEMLEQPAADAPAEVPPMVEDTPAEFALRHLDIGEFATRVHRKHLCENTTEGPGTGCGHLWVPHPWATKGVERLAGTLLPIDPEASPCVFCSKREPFGNDPSEHYADCPVAALAIERRAHALRADVLRHLEEQNAGLRLLIAELTPLAEKQRAAEAELAHRRAEFAACTDMNASWCPVHGTCVCERGPAGDCDFDGEDCPLHASASLHAVPPMEDSEVKPVTAPTHDESRVITEHRLQFQEWDTFGNRDRATLLAAAEQTERERDELKAKLEKAIGRAPSVSSGEREAERAADAGTHDREGGRRRR